MFYPPKIKLCNMIFCISNLLNMTTSLLSITYNFGITCNVALLLTYIFPLRSTQNDRLCVSYYTKVINYAYPY